MAPRTKNEKKKNDGLRLESELIQILLWGIGLLLVLCGLVALFEGAVLGWVALIPGLVMIICAVLGARK